VSVIGRSANSTGGPADIAADANGKILGRLSNALGFATLSDFIDAIGSTRGSILYRGSSSWAALTPGTSGYVLTSNGAGADPTYEAASGGSFVPITTSFTGIGVGASVYLIRVGSGSDADGATTSGSNLRVEGTNLNYGTWRNDSGATIGVGATGLYTRVA
jgi:hypothetical protein